MSLNYAKGTPVGNNQVPFVGSPNPSTALVTTVRDNAVVSSILNLGHDTTAIEVTATNGPVFIKWLQQTVVDSSVAGTSVISAAGTANFDHTVATNTVRRFVVPIATTPQTTSVQGINRAQGLYRNVAIKTGNIASVATTEH